MQVQGRGVQQRPGGGRRMPGIAVHLRRLAEQHVHRQVDRRIGGDPARQRAVTGHQALLGRSHAHGGERAALARADRGELVQPVGRHAQHVAFLGLVAPQFQRRQRRIVGGHLAQVDHPTHARVVQQFGDGVGQATGTDVVEEVDRVALAHRHAAVDDLLAATLHLRVVALHAGEVQVLGALAGGHRTGRAAAQADQHRRAAQHDHRIAGLQRDLFDLDAVDRAQAAGQHDRLVVGAGDAGLGQLEAAEVAQQIGPAELVVEGGTAQRAIGHDLQRRGHARVERARRFPGLRQRRDAQVRDRKPGQAGLGLAATAGGALVADLAAGAGGGTRERRDRGGVVVGLDLDLEGRRQRRLGAVLAAGRVGAVAGGHVPCDHRGVVAVGAQGVLRGLVVGVADHPEQRMFLFAPVDAPAGIEDLVPAVLGIGLGEHHQFHVRRIAAQFAIAGAQVLDLVVGQGQAQAPVGTFQVGQRDALQPALRLGGEQRLRRLGRGQQRLGHRVVQQPPHGRSGGGIGGPARQVQAQSAFDPGHGQAGPLQQFGGLARPRRARTQPRHHVTRAGTGRGRRRRVTGLEDAMDRLPVRHAFAGLDEVDLPGRFDAQAGNQGLQAGLETLPTERRKGGRALEDDHVRGSRRGKAGHCTGAGRPQPGRPVPGRDGPGPPMVQREPPAGAAGSPSSACSSCSGGR